MNTLRRGKPLPALCRRCISFRENTRCKSHLCRRNLLSTPLQRSMVDYTRKTANESNGQQNTCMASRPSHSYMCPFLCIEMGLTAACHRCIHSQTDTVDKLHRNSANIGQLHTTAAIVLQAEMRRGSICSATFLNAPAARRRRYCAATSAHGFQGLHCQWKFELRFSYLSIDIIIFFVILSGWRRAVPWLWGQAGNWHPLACARNYLLVRAGTPEGDEIVVQKLPSTISASSLGSGKTNEKRLTLHERL